MALSRIVAIGDGVTTQFAIPFALGYLRRSDITCRVGTEQDGAGNPIYRTMTFVGEELVDISGAPPAAGVRVEFSRTVARDTMLVDYEDGDIINEENMNAAQKQALMLVHEVLDGRFEGLQSDINLNGWQITNLGDPTEQSDAATKKYVDDRLAGNQASANAAAQSAALASTHASAAASSSAAAQTALSGAQSAETVAVNAANSTAGAVSAANTSAVAAEAAKVAAASSATSAAASAASVGTVASSAEASAVRAETAATSAGNSASTASAAATTASAAASDVNAGVSASAASATAAAASAADAASARQSAILNASSAESSANAAQTRAGQAATSATNAFNSANDADAHRMEANGSATAAAGSATAAAASATAAAASATSASASAVRAETAASAIEDGLDAVNVSFSPAGGLSSTNVQAAIEEAANMGGGGGGGSVYAEVLFEGVKPGANGDALNVRWLPDAWDEIFIIDRTLADTSFNKTYTFRTAQTGLARSAYTLRGRKYTGATTPTDDLFVLNGADLVLARDAFARSEVRMILTGLRTGFTNVELQYLLPTTTEFVSAQGFIQSQTDKIQGFSLVIGNPGKPSPVWYNNILVVGKRYNR